MTEEIKNDGKKSEDNESGWDEALLPVLQDIAGRVTDGICDTRPIAILISSLSPSVVMMSSGLPSFVGFISSKLATSMFKSPIYRDLFKDSLIESARHLRDKIQQKGGVEKLSNKEYGDAVKDGFKTAAEKKYVIIDGLLHSPSCVRMQHRIKKPQGKDQQEQQSGNVEVTLLEAEQQHIMCAPCCFDGVESDIKAKTAAPAKVEPPKPKPHSPMEVLYSADPEKRTKFLALLKAVPAAERPRYDELLKHMDSVEEFNMLLLIMEEQPEIAAELLTLLENSGPLHMKQQALLAAQAIERHAENALSAIKSGFKHAGKTVVEFDQSFAPVANRLRENDAREKPDNTFAVAFGAKKPANKGFLTGAWRFTKSLFLFF